MAFISMTNPFKSFEGLAFFPQVLAGKYERKIPQGIFLKKRDYIFKNPT